MKELISFCNDNFNKKRPVGTARSASYAVSGGGNLVKVHYLL